jgi:hypothetical protein
MATHSRFFSLRNQSQRVNPEPRLLAAPMIESMQERIVAQSPPQLLSFT